MRAPPVLLAALLSAACAAPSSYVGRPAAELAALGRPAGEFANPDGTRTLAFSPGYFSGLTYMADVDASGTVRGVRQALVEESFQQVVPGMTRDEILRLIGPPVESMEFARRREVSWEYRFVDAWGYRALFHVNFDQSGVVVGKFTRRLDADRFPFR